ncbi:HAMP domain-containing histidine kinase [Sphingobium sp. 10 DY56-G10]|uniref:HAMP domain-containing sensor histidine kinase n=1 Tax=Sphingomonadales TaxID=204457 RepID=UPI0000D7B721|nr:HAMP domain-containing sensor histidine kinase [Sphingomonas sp. SKA58]EAT10353.1 Sensory transduction histidine kinase [Sphingomonas sp. SKA58]|tara:strand:- start:4650 stop:6011 length:1362 start_codon:yes stop_codon:yes gene_type:complete
MPDRRRRRLGAITRIAASFVIFYTIATLALGAAIFVIGENALREQLDDRITAESDFLLDVHRLRGMQGVAGTLRRRDDRGVNALGYLLTDRTGQRLGGELTTDRPPAGWAQIEFRDQDGKRNVGRALTVDLAGGGSLTVAMEMAPERALRRTTFLLLVAGVGATLMGGIVGGIWLTRAIRSRLKAMNTTAQGIISGDMNLRMPVVQPRDEFGQLAETLNTMLDRHSELIENLREVSSGIAHDLRTPLTKVRQRLERMAALVPGGGLLHEEVERTIAEVDATLSIFAALLRIAEVEAGTIRQYFRVFDLGAAVTDLCESYTAVAEDGDKSLTCSLAADVNILGDMELVAQALVNLLENALRYTPPQTVIEVILANAGGRAVLSVIDNGPGVPTNRRDTLTRRFVRGDQSRASPGHGLGLNLVQAVAKVHGGWLQLEDARPGLRVDIVLPLSSAD